MSDDEPLIVGEITFEGTVSPFSNATVYVRLEDVSRVDAPSRVVLEQVISSVSYQPGDVQRLKIKLYGELPDVAAQYAINVHVDVDRDGQISQGDYINMQSYPVLTFGYPNQVSVRVRRV